MPEMTQAKAIMIWLRLCEQGYEAMIERAWKYRKQERGYFYRVRVPLRPLGREQVDGLLELARVHEVKVTFSTHSPAEPTLEMM